MDFQTHVFVATFGRDAVNPKQTEIRIAGHSLEEAQKMAYERAIRDWGDANDFILGYVYSYTEDENPIDLKICR